MQFKSSQKASNGLKKLPMVSKSFQWSKKASDGLKKLPMVSKSFRWSQKASDGLSAYITLVTTKQMCPLLDPLMGFYTGAYHVTW